MKLILASLLAAVAMHAYGTISFMLLGWHAPKPVVESAALTAAIPSSFPEHGVYMLPSTVKADGSTKDMDTMMKESVQGPYLFAVVRPGQNHRPFISLILANYVYCALTALVLGLILMRVPLGYWSLVKMSGMIGLFVGFMTWLPQYNWYEYPWAWCWPHIVDSVVMSLLAGAILAKFVMRKVAPRTV